ncbi:uncharacterized protein YbjT (DUF2867 family) [Neomicrococcus aestuarii]|uniref:Uncharacterized protein YbjT (DUF2867 family) n=1 Tax=Neomicrococcus aestuarii TaxID=556325 RepID=A0A7W8TTE6_9MICC|nr:NAD(P)H-binding protein [Neomicrococcus aestuarii]MBB5512504.1 uncharacterized protein YbjT (DUF2867 family) [Neomicrococcus aestuarii]
MRVAVLGGTGTIGKRIVLELRRRGVETIALSRAQGVDALSGSGLVAALQGVDVVVDALNTNTFAAATAKRFFITTANHVAYAARVNDVQRVVCVSIVNATDPAVLRTNGYYAGKAAQENAYLKSGLPVQIVRTTQWFELAEQLSKQLRVGRFAVVPRMLSQPIAAARFVAENVLADPWEPIAEIGGPAPLDLAAAAQRIASKDSAAADSASLKVFPIPLPGPMGSGGLLPAAGTRTDSETFEQWLSRR